MNYNNKGYHLLSVRLAKMKKMNKTSWQVCETVTALAQSSLKENFSTVYQNGK